MNIKLLTLGALLVSILFSCSKNTDDNVDPPPPVDSLPPLQLMKKITRYQVTGSGPVLADSVAFSYDEKGRLTATVDPRTNQPTRKLVYDGDGLVALVDFINGQPDTLHNPVSFGDNGNTMFIDHTRPSADGPTDTIKLTYKWSGDQILESWTYLSFPSANFQNFQKSIFTYDAAGNFYDEKLIANDGSSNWQATALAYDDKKNFFRTLSRLNYIFIGWGFPTATRSVNNPIKGESPGGQFEYIWTYNDEGYPLTMQVKGKDFIAAEFYYNR